MDYLKVWTSFRETISPLDDAEKGRLFDAMLLYAETGEEPDRFEGNERFLWIVAKQDIDRMAQKCETLKANASKGGIAKSRNRLILANDSKLCQTLANDGKTEQTEANHSYNIKKCNVKKDNKNTSPWFDEFWNAYPRHVNKQAAMKAFEKAKIDGELLNVILTAIEKQKGSDQWTKDNGQFIPHPATWLNGKRWEDEVVTGTGKKAVSAQQYEQRDYDDEQAEAMKRMLKGLGA